jgi:hypothetical protein
MPTRQGKPTGKKVVKDAVKREIEKARRDFANGKGVAVGELLIKVLERDGRKQTG